MAGDVGQHVISIACGGESLDMRVDAEVIKWPETRAKWIEANAASAFECLFLKAGVQASVADVLRRTLAELGDGASGEEVASVTRMIEASDAADGQLRGHGR